MGVSGVSLELALTVGVDETLGVDEERGEDEALAGDVAVVE